MLRNRLTRVLKRLNPQFQLPKSIVRRLKLPLNSTSTRLLAIVGLATILSACLSYGPQLPPPPVHTNGQVLWRIVHDQCVAGQRAASTPNPCERVVLDGAEDNGFALLKDRVGVAQYLLLPTAKITGIEDPKLLLSTSPNYFLDAWNARQALSAKLGRTLDREQVAIVVNSIYGRSQDQLHLHLDCVAPSVKLALKSDAALLDDRWSLRSIDLGRFSFQVRWVSNAELQSASPFVLLAKGVPGARRSMGSWTLGLVGAQKSDGQQGFYLLAAQANASGVVASSEDLEDHACKAA